MMKLGRRDAIKKKRIDDLLSYLYPGFIPDLKNYPNIEDFLNLLEMAQSFNSEEFIQSSLWSRERLSMVKDATLKAGNLMLDPLTRRVTQGGRVVDLSPREFALLEFLMRNAGRTVSRSRIAEAVWNYKFDPETNVVDVYVNYLRKKLSFAGQTAPIRTVRGIGYRLEAS